MSDDPKGFDQETPTVSARVVEAEARQVLLTRAEAARRMNVSVATVRRMEGEQLHPIVVDGKHLFDIEELDRHRKLTDGDLAAAAFELFNADRTQVDAVIELKEAPERIRKLFRDWAEMSECVVAGPPGIGRRQLQRYFQGPLSRRMIWICLNIVLGTPALRARAERELGHPIV